MSRIDTIETFFTVWKKGGLLGKLGAWYKWACLDELLRITSMSNIFRSSG
jgi:hypothetical protein